MQLSLLLIATTLFLILGATASAYSCEEDYIGQLYSNITKLSLKVDQEFSRMKDESSAVFVLGDTGSGKSTLINFLTGAPLTIKKHEYVKEYYIENVNLESLPIGHEAKSKTKMPALVSDSKENTFIDTAGF